jgi:predicted nucleic acid-binding protein
VTVVVADTSPLRYLAVIHSLQVLPALFSRVVLPGTVLQELSHPNAPLEARAFAAALPPWVEVGHADSTLLLSVLDPGEAEAIALAEAMGVDVVLIDEREARKEATRRGLLTIGTIGILEQAAAKDLVDLPVALGKLSETNFRIDPRYLEDALRRDAARREFDRSSERRTGRGR